ncbi:MAG: HD domain-containing phosphohydrolase [Actinomycetota bacterium]
MVEAKIMVVADVVEAMTSHRPYRPALELGEAIKKISKNRKKLYDASVVDACMKIIEEGRFLV